MQDFTGLEQSERRDIIAEAAAGMGVDFTIVEKDFWVCWTLRSLFSLAPGHAPMVFKGGTSLSKAYALIQRFSEDIDVVTAVDFYLERGVADPDVAPSRTQQVQRMKALDVACADYIGGALAGTLRQQFAERLGTDTGWELSVDLDDAHTLLFRYPASAPDIVHQYIRERVRIELGWRSSSPRALPSVLLRQRLSTLRASHRNASSRLQRFGELPCELVPKRSEKASRREVPGVSKRQIAI